jgi:hypothetical protein
VDGRATCLSESCSPHIQYDAKGIFKGKNLIVFKGFDIHNDSDRFAGVLTGPRITEQFIVNGNKFLNILAQPALAQVDIKPLGLFDGGSFFSNRWEKRVSWSASITIRV